MFVSVFAQGTYCTPYSEGEGGGALAESHSSEERYHSRQQPPDVLAVFSAYELMLFSQHIDRHGAVATLRKNKNLKRRVISAE